MGASIQVFLRDTSLPTVDAWNAAIKAEGFGVVIHSFDLRADDGYRPADLKDKESGFEWYLARVAEIADDRDFPFKTKIGDCNVRASLCFTSRADEDITSMVAAAVLAKLTGGFYWDPETDARLYRGDDAIAVARKAVYDRERTAKWPLMASALLALVVLALAGLLLHWLRKRKSRT